MGLEPRSLTRLLKSMEEKGLIYRKTDQTDKRSVRIMLTPEGEQYKEKAKASVIKFNEMINGQIPKEKLAVFFEVIQHVNELIETNKIYETQS